MTCNWSDDIWNSDQNNIECVCVSPTASKGQIKFVKSVLQLITDKDFKRKLTISGGQQRPKLVSVV